MTEDSAAGQWDDPIQLLLTEGVIKGYGLVDQTGVVKCAYGEGQKHLLADPNGVDASDLAKEIQKSLSEDLPPESLVLAGSTLRVLRKEDDAIYALSEGKTEGVMAYKLKIGVLIVLFGAPRVAQQVVPKVEMAVEPLRSTGPSL